MFINFKQNPEIQKLSIPIHNLFIFENSEPSKEINWVFC